MIIWLRFLLKRLTGNDMKKVIVTGANGFVGKNVCRFLSSAGVEVIAVIKDENEYIDEIKDLDKLRIVYCDLEHIADLEKIISDRDADVFYHFAWVGSAGPLRADCDVQINNIRYTCEAVKLCSALNIKRFVFASSIMEYEIMKLMDSSSRPSGNTLYSSAKLSADFMARTVASSFGVDYIRAVISNIYGPGETSPRLINSSIRKMLSGERCSFSPGEQMYDFIYVDDAAKTFVALGEKGITDKTYYIGSKNPRPLKEFLIEMKDCVNPDLELGLGDFTFNGISLSYEEFDINAVSEDTGFVPEVSFSEGIKNTMDWIRENS